MLKSFIVAVLLAMGVLTSVEPLVVQGYDPGGSVGTYIQWWERVAQMGNPVIIDGACISACTLVLGIVPDERICMTDRGSFGFHLASTDQGPDPALTELLQRTQYPTWVQAWIKAHGPMEEEVKYATLKDFQEHIRKCTEDDLKATGVTS